MIQRLARDESGMTMGLAIMMILLISVMGAGLLTFVSRDLNTVVEVNRGQRAFEVADAGVEAAKRQLASNVLRENYDGDGSPTGDGACGSDDIQWSALRCDGPDGLTLTDLDGVASTVDRVTVTIEYNDEQDEFKVISTGTYGDVGNAAIRKIEAIFDGVEVGAGGGNSLGHPLYYTPSDIKIESPISLAGISMFTEGDILLESPYTDAPYNGVNDRADFKRDMRDNNGGTLQGGNVRDALRDWCTTDEDPDSLTPNCDNDTFDDIYDNWNTEGRDQNRTEYAPPGSGSHLAGGVPLDQPGLGAAGKICGISIGSSAATCPTTSQSIADGVYAYDCTTGPVNVQDTELCPDGPQTRGNNLTFVDKDNPALDLGGDGYASDDPNPPGTISFPFPRPTPIPAELWEQSQGSDDCTTPRTSVDPDTGLPFEGCTYKGSPTSIVWNELFPSSGDSDRIVFIDAQNSTTPITFDMGSPNVYKGVLVVWCGNLVQQQDFDGIVLNLVGDGTSFGGSSCSADDGVGIYRNAGQKANDNSIITRGWLYAEGGTESRAGIELGRSSRVEFSNDNWSFLNSAFEGPPPTSFALKSWRELYQ